MLVLVFVSKDKVIKVIKYLKNNKSLGCDEIPVTLMKKLPIV